jgi:hypothetical protein
MKSSAAAFVDEAPEAEPTIPELERELGRAQQRHSENTVGLEKATTACDAARSARSAALESGPRSVAFRKAHQEFLDVEAEVELYTEKTKRTAGPVKDAQARLLAAVAAAKRAQRLAEVEALVKEGLAARAEAEDLGRRAHALLLRRNQIFEILKTYDDVDGVVKGQKLVY